MKIFFIAIIVSFSAFSNTELLDAAKKREEQHFEYRAFSWRTGALFAVALYTTLDRHNTGPMLKYAAWATFLASFLYEFPGQLSDFVRAEKDLVDAVNRAQGTH